MKITRLWSYLTTILVIGIIVYLILLYITAQSLSAKIIGVEKLGFDPLTGNVKACFNVQVNNTGVIDVTIEKIYYRVYVNGEYLGEGSREDVVIKRGVNTVKICLVSESRDIVKILKQLIIRGGKANVTIEGYVDIPIKSFGVIKMWSVELPFREEAYVEIYHAKLG